MGKLCCISETLAARFIGAFDLSVAILAINFIMREFFTLELGLNAFDEVNIFLDLGSWVNTSTYLRPRLLRKWILGCHMVYSIIHLICSACLILATIFRKKAYAMPWLIFEVISLANQASGVAVYIFEHECSYESMASTGPAYVPMASLYFFLGVYFWLVVYAARESWPAGTSQVSLELKESTLEKSYVVDLSSAKTPSNILSVDHSVFESPEPPVPAKYYPL